MLLVIGAGVMALAFGQADTTWNRAGNPQQAEPDPSAATATPAAPGPQPLTTNDIAGPAGVPFMPTVGRPPVEARGVFLDLALLSQFRTRSLNLSDGSTAWGTDFEVTPGIALQVVTPSLSLSVGYAPRLTLPVATGNWQLAVLHRATLRAEWRVDTLWTVTALGVFLVGDYSQLVPASTPAGPGPVPPVFDPVRSFQTYPYVGIDTQVRLDGILSPRTRLTFMGGYFDLGGTGPVGEANQPRAWGPQGEVGLSWDPSRKSTLTTTAAGQDWMMSGTENFFITTLTENWRQAWTSEFETTLGLGGGFANREVESRTAAGNIVPVARASMVYQTLSLQPVRLALDLALAPFFDTYVRSPYQRFTLSISLDWHPSDAWRVGASFTGALAPYTLRAPESYGTAGLSASFAPVQFLILTLGAFNQSQFQGATDGGGAFRQFTAYFSLTLIDQLSL
jgi:hypothetical protein